MASPCGHLYCFECLDLYKKCPVCKVKLEEPALCPVIEQILEVLQTTLKETERPMLKPEKELEVRIEPQQEVKGSSTNMSESSKDAEPDSDDSDEETKGNKTVYVRGLANSWENKHLASIFGKYGKISSIYIKRCEQEEFTYAFIEYE